MLSIPPPAQEYLTSGYTVDRIVHCENPCPCGYHGDPFRECAGSRKSCAPKRCNAAERFAIGGLGTGRNAERIAERSTIGAICHSYEIDAHALGANTHACLGVLRVHGGYDAAQNATINGQVTPYREVTPI